MPLINLRVKSIQDTTQHKSYMATPPKQQNQFLKETGDVNFKKIFLKKNEIFEVHHTNPTMATQIPGLLIHEIK